MSDVGRGSRADTRSGHDVVTGPDINFDFPDAKLGCMARLGSSDVAQDHRPTEKQAPAGKLAGFSALGTHKVTRHPSPGAAGPAAGTLTRLAMITTATRQSVETDHVIAYRATDLGEYGLHSLTMN